MTNTAAIQQHLNLAQSCTLTASWGELHTVEGTFRAGISLDSVYLPEQRAACFSTAPHACHLTPHSCQLSYATIVIQNNQTTKHSGKKK